MQKAEEVTAVLAAETEKFSPIRRKPMDSDISSMCEVLTPILKGIDYDPL